MFMESTGIWAVTVLANLDVGGFSQTNSFRHLANLFFSIRVQLSTFGRHIAEGKDSFGVIFTVPENFIVDVAEETPPNLEARLRQNPRLKSQIWKMNSLH